MNNGYENPLLKIIADHKKGLPVGAYSVCSANLHVLRAAMIKAREDDSHLLIEATCNQVNQFGGYTGLTPEQFIRYVADIARETGLPLDKLQLGGDHLGPGVWQNENVETAMRKARDLVHDYVEAGFTKIHLDASMPCADDKSTLHDETVAERSADLCEVAEASLSLSKQPFIPPVYIIGTEVPMPGGAREQLTELQVTGCEEVDKNITVTGKAFFSRNLGSAWERVIAVVVQPGVEFGSHMVVDYDRGKASALSRFIESYDNLVYEAHSTDYQKKEALKEMVEDHFGILKVGPWLTFAFREAVFALAAIENELFAGRKSVELSLIHNVIEKEMCENPVYWVKYYHGDEASQALERKYSFSDRIRYYWYNPNIQKALDILIMNLSRTQIPISLLSQYLPSQYVSLRKGLIKNTPLELINDKIIEILDCYSYACGMKK